MFKLKEGGGCSLIENSFSFSFFSPPLLQMRIFSEKERKKRDERRVFKLKERKKRDECLS